ncbi:cytochrome P450 [Zopfochytrium polystomum]|nr:cytochrome P450 [Zopfochytrium polystomum]
MLSLSRLILSATSPLPAADSGPPWLPSVPSTLTVAVAVAVAVPLAAAAALVYTVVLPPRNFPRDVPVVPFWVSMLPFLRKKGRPLFGQDELYKRFIRPRMDEKGIVTMWFGGRWNLIVGHPRYARALFLNTGKQLFLSLLVLPYSLIAYYTGENIIASHGATWSRFRRVVAPALKQLAADGGPPAFAACVDAFCAHVDTAVAARDGGRLVVGDLVQRFCMDAVSGAVLGRSLETLTTPAGHALSQTVLRVKRGIFDPLFLFFPALDRLALMLRGSARARLRADVDALYAALVVAVAGVDPRVTALRVADAAGLGTPGAAEAAAAREERARTVAAAAAAAGGKKAQPAATPASLMEAMLDAVEAGEWSVTEFRYNFMITFIAGHENVQQCLTSLLYILAIHQDAQDRCRHEARSVLGGKGATSIATWTAADTAQLVYLSKVIRETLRLLPPLPQLANRQAARVGAVLDDVAVPRGAYVAWHAFGLHHSEAVWRDPDAFDPERWGDDGKVRGGGAAGPLAEDPFAFIAFAGGLRQCLGQKLAMTEVTTFMASMLLRYRWSLPADREFKMTPAGILAPMGLELMVEAL